MPRKKKIVGGALRNEEKPGPAGETQGIIPVTTSEEKNPSAPILTAMPHPPPEYKPTEPLHHNIVPTLPPTATLASQDDHTLPHNTQPSAIRMKVNHAIKPSNPLVFTGQQTYGPPAHRFVTSGDNRHIVLKGGGLSAKNFTRAGDKNAYLHPFSGGELGLGDNASGELEGGSIHSIYNRVAADTMTAGLNEANIAVDKQQNKINARNDAKQAAANPKPVQKSKSHGAGIREKHTELVGGGYKAMGAGRVGGKSAWAEIGKNLSGTALNVTKFAAENPELLALAFAA